MSILFNVYDLKKMVQLIHPLYHIYWTYVENKVEE